MVSESKICAAVMSISGFQTGSKNWRKASKSSPVSQDFEDTDCDSFFGGQ